MDLIESIGAELAEVGRSRRPIPPILGRYPDFSLQDAYRVARFRVRKRLSAGGNHMGYKLALTSASSQSAFKAHEPVFGRLSDDMLVSEKSNGVFEAAFDRYLTPRVEPELAFVLKNPLSAEDATIQRVLEVTEYVTPAIEIVDFRIAPADPETGFNRQLQDLVSDNAAGAGVVLDGTRFSPLEVNTSGVSTVIYRNGLAEDRGSGASVLGNPAAGVVWLAKALAAQGESLMPGDVVLTGSLTRPLPVSHGERFDADFGPFGTVSVHFY